MMIIDHMRFVLMLMATLVLAAGAAAHGETVIHGRYALTLGWLVEPPIVDNDNAIYLKVVDNSAEGGPAGVTHAHQTVRVELSLENATRVFELKPHNSLAGEFISRFIPTAPETYEARVFGALGGTNFTHSQKIEPVLISRLDQWPTEGPTTKEAVRELDAKDAEIESNVAMVGALRDDLASANATIAALEAQNAELEERVPFSSLPALLLAIACVALLSRRSRR